MKVQMLKKLMVSTIVLCLAGGQSLRAETYFSVHSDMPGCSEDASTWVVEHHAHHGHATRPPGPDDDVIVRGEVTTDGMMKKVNSLTIEPDGSLQAQGLEGNVFIMAKQDIVIHEGGCIVALTDSQIEDSGGVCRLEAGRDLVMSGLHGVGILADFGIFVHAQGVVDLTGIPAQTNVMLSPGSPVVFESDAADGILLDPGASLDSITATDPVVFTTLEGFEDYDSERTFKGLSRDFQEDFQGLSTFKSTFKRLSRATFKGQPFL